MITLKDNIKAVLDCNFSEVKDEIKESALNAILELINADYKTKLQKWETPPKFEHKGIITICVSVPMALIEDEPQTEYDEYREKIRAHDPHKDWFENEPLTKRSK